MKVEGTYHFDGPQRIVWETLQDPEVLGQVMPGGEGLEKTGDDEYSVTLKVKVGPVNGKFKGGVKLLNINEPETYSMEVDGRGQPGFVKGVGDVRLEADGDKTFMHYEGDAQVGGRIASVGQRLMDSTSKAMIKQALDGLNEYVKARVEAEAAAQPVVEAPAETIEPTPAVDAVPATPSVDAMPAIPAEPATPAAPVVAKTTPKPKIEIKQPTQIEFALGIFKNMVDDAITPHWQPIVLPAIGLVIGLIIGLLVG